MLIRLEAWAARKFDPAPSINTLRAWANAGLISPPAVKVGRSWMVDEDAEYCPSAPDVQGASDRVLSILGKSA